MSLERVPTWQYPNIQPVKQNIEGIEGVVEQLRKHIVQHNKEHIEESIARIEDFEGLEVNAGTITDLNVATLTLSGLTASKPVFTTASKALTSSGTTPVDQGGTGQTSFTNGQLLIGNTTGSTLAKATLSAGNGVGITNSTGSVTIDAEEAIMWAVLLGG